MNKHYYVEDISIDKRVDNIKPTEYVHSIQFDKMSDHIYINIDQPMNWQKSGKRALRASVNITLEDLENAVKWLKE